MFKFRRRSLCSAGSVVKEDEKPTTTSSPIVRSRSEEKQQSNSNPPTENHTDIMCERKRKERHESGQSLPIFTSPESRHHQPAKSPESQRQLERQIDYQSSGKSTTSTSSKRRSRKTDPTVTSSPPIPTVTISPAGKSAENGGKMSFLEEIRGEHPPLLSPRTSFLSRPDTASPIDLPPSPPMRHENNATDSIGGNLNSAGENAGTNLKKQATLLKKSLKSQELEYESIFGTKPTHGDKLRHSGMRKCLVGLAGVKRELAKGQQSQQQSLSATVQGILDKSCGGKINELSREELVAEKVLLQRELLGLERRHGRPRRKEDKEVVRGVYERYRGVKRVLGDSGGGLGVIDEGGVLDIRKDGDGEEAVVAVEQKQCELEEQNFNEMELPTLLQHHSALKDEKRSLRRSLKRFEREFQLSNGRLPLKQEKVGGDMEGCYLKYKKARAEVRLLEVLIKKSRL